MSCSLIEASYGKSRVRLTKVIRGKDQHDIKDISVDIQLQGEFDDSYLSGNNEKIVATDSIKNTVYAIAADHSFDSIEDFAKDLADHFLTTYKHVQVASVAVSEELWQRILANGKPHKHSFVGGNREKRVVGIDAMRGCISVESGIEDLVVLKTADSEFSGFIRDEFTTLADVRDRILSTSLEARWIYKSSVAPFNDIYSKLRQLLLDLFTQHHSLSVQQTLYFMGKAVLDAFPDVEEIRITMPNQHRTPFDMTRLNKENKNEIFVPTDEPYGLISATLSRSIRPCMEPPAMPAGAKCVDN